MMTLLAEPILSADTAERYEVIDPAAVRAYLAARPHLIALLEDAPQQIARFFPDAPLRLEVQIDPDLGTMLLLLGIGTRALVEEALTQMEHLLERWYLDLPYDVQRDVLPVLRYQ
jgi:hypothetical protein